MGAYEVIWLMGLILGHGVIGFLTSRWHEQGPIAEGIKTACVTGLVANALLAFTLTSFEYLQAYALGAASIRQMIPAIVVVALFFCLLFSLVGISGTLAGFFIERQWQADRSIAVEAGKEFATSSLAGHARGYWQSAWPVAPPTSAANRPRGLFVKF